MQYQVAPYVGAWIETSDDIIFKGYSVSHPMWVRGLKLERIIELRQKVTVAPYVGAWIETILRSNCTVI